MTDLSKIDWSKCKLDGAKVVYDHLRSLLYIERQVDSLRLVVARFNSEEWDYHASITKRSNLEQAFAWTDAVDEFIKEQTKPNINDSPWPRKIRTELIYNAIREEMCILCVNELTTFELHPCKSCTIAITTSKPSNFTPKSENDKITCQNIGGYMNKFYAVCDAHGRVSHLLEANSLWEAKAELEAAVASRTAWEWVDSAEDDLGEAETPGVLLSVDGWDICEVASK